MPSNQDAFTIAPKGQYKSLAYTYDGYTDWVDYNYLASDTFRRIDSDNHVERPTFPHKLVGSQPHIPSIYNDKFYWSQFGLTYFGLIGYSDLDGGTYSPIIPESADTKDYYYDSFYFGFIYNIEKHTCTP